MRLSQQNKGPSELLTEKPGARFVLVHPAFAFDLQIADERLRSRCIALGELLGLYRDYPVSRGCTSPFLPIWIESVVGKERSRVK